jgi:hypothetical protein
MDWIHQMRYGWAVLMLCLGNSCTLAHQQEELEVVRHASSLAETIVLTPTVVPEELAEFSAAMEEVDSLIAAALKATGFRLVPAGEYATIWERLMERVGGVLDSATGERMEERFEVARRQLLNELDSRYDPDALLYPEIWIVDAAFSEGAARWDGTSQALIGLGTRLIHALGAAFSGSESNLPSGTVEALSLVVFLEDMDGEELYANSGGIEVLEKVGSDPRDRRRVPDQKLFTNHARIRRAVALALDPLLSGTYPDGGSRQPH